jgi:DNA helicase-4
MKSNNHSIADVRNKNKKAINRHEQKRNALFIDIIEPLYEQYECHLEQRNEIDFSDMINKATHYISNGQVKPKYSYVIIDEFQDISIGRYKLVKAIKKANPSCKLFCVGDDWQSIYRFTGSDSALFKDFKKYFGYTVQSKIETTYRFHPPLLELSSEFIQKNPNQVKKNLKDFSKDLRTEYKIVPSASKGQGLAIAVQNILNKLIDHDPKIKAKEIFILGRYNQDFNQIKSTNSNFKFDVANTITFTKMPGKGKSIQAQIMTMHLSKGLEADIVIILIPNSGKFRFPSIISDDPVLDLLLSAADKFENAEERRLFYVAMTRAKEKVYFVTDSSDHSKFIKELGVDSGQSPDSKCPMCKTGDIVNKKVGRSKAGAPYKFFGCSNYNYGCDYNFNEWPK